MGHRTGCGIIYNESSVPFAVYDPQSHRGAGVPANGNFSLECSVAFGWCNEDTHIRTRAFRFSSLPSSGSVDEFYLFETFDKDIDWTPMAGPNAASFEMRQHAGASDVGCVHVRILANKTPRVEVVWT